MSEQLRTTVLADRVVQMVAELPDRTSPEDWPEAMLVTADELRDVLVAALAGRLTVNENDKSAVTICTHPMIGQVLSGAIFCRDCGRKFELINGLLPESRTQS